jgi:hypothetical protein
MDNIKLTWRKVKQVIDEYNKIGAMLLFELKSRMQQSLDAIVPNK